MGPLFTFYLLLFFVFFIFFDLSFFEITPWTIGTRMVCCFYNRRRRQSIDRYCRRQYIVKMYPSIHIVGDNRWVILSIDRHCRSKIDRQPRPSIDIVSHNVLCDMSIDGHCLPQETASYPSVAIVRLSLMDKIYRYILSVTMDCGRYQSIDIVGDNRLVIIEIDRHCRTQDIVNRVHR